jgi:dynein assembly factor 5
LTVLQDSRSIDRSAKRRAVQNLHDNGLNLLKDPIVAREFLQKTLTLLFNTIAHDCVEKCREQCLEFVYKAFSPVKDTSFALLEVVDLCKKRVTLSGKMREPAEESEEIRLGVLRLLNLIVSKCSAPTIKPTIADDILSIVQSCINDKFPDVQKEACAILLTLTEKKSTYLGYFGDKVTKVVVPVLRHKHAALRVLGIKVTE